MVVARENGMANQVSPPDMKPHTPCKFDLTVKIISQKNEVLYLKSVRKPFCLSLDLD